MTSNRLVVLIVEDEPLLRLYASDTFEDMGYDVIEAENADEALLILETRDDIAFLFTDIDMPGSMDGLKLAHAVSHRWPPICVIVTSGLANQRKIVMPERGHFVGKPYGPAQIETALRSFRGA